MDIKEAVIWNKKTGKPISIVGDEYNQQYGLHYGKLTKFNPGKSCTHSTSGLDVGEILADWQEWQEHREYVDYWQAMISILLDKKEYNVDLESRPYVYSEKDGQVVFTDRSGESFRHIPKKETMNAKWYEHKPTPIDPVNDSKESEWSNCPECNILAMYDGEKFRCKNCGVTWPGDDGEPVFNKDDNIIGCGAGIPPEKPAFDFNDYELPDVIPTTRPEPVFDLTYEEARQLSYAQTTYVKAEEMDDEKWIFTTRGWVNGNGNRPEQYQTAANIVILSRQKWRIVS